MTDGIPLAVNCKFPDSQIEEGPDIVGDGNIVKVRVASQPAEFLKVIVTVPGETPITSPTGVTVAIKLFEDVQGVVLSGIPIPTNKIGFKTHPEKGPDTAGDGKTEIK